MSTTDSTKKTAETAENKDVDTKKKGRLGSFFETVFDVLSEMAIPPYREEVEKALENKDVQLATRGHSHIVLIDGGKTVLSVYDFARAMEPGLRRDELQPVKDEVTTGVDFLDAILDVSASMAIARLLRSKEYELVRFGSGELSDLGIKSTATGRIFSGSDIHAAL